MAAWLPVLPRLMIMIMMPMTIPIIKTMLGCHGTAQSLECVHALSLSPNQIMVGCHTKNNDKLTGDLASSEGRWESVLCGDGKGVGESVSSLRVRESIEGTVPEDDIEASKLHEKFLRSGPGSAFVGHPTHRVWGGGGGYHREGQRQGRSNRISGDRVMERDCRYVTVRRTPAKSLSLKRASASSSPPPHHSIKD